MRTSTLEKFDFTPAYFDNRYEVFSTVGRGRGSVVYKARRLSSDEVTDLTVPPIALKVLLGIERDPDVAIKRIKREALALLSCKSPAVIRMYDYVAREDTCYLTMEYAKYSDLRRLFEEGRPDLSTAAILKLVQGILEGVACVHEAGIIHRDLKLENFLLTEDYQVKVADFSVCLLKGERTDIQLLNEVVGTFDYTAPECLKGGGYSRSSDLYSVGVSAFEMLSGSVPTIGSTVKDMLEDKSRGRIRNLPADVLEEYPDLKSFFKKALHPDVDQRFQSAEEMSGAIGSVLSGKFKIHKQNINKSEILNRCFSFEKSKEALSTVQTFLYEAFELLSITVTNIFAFLKGVFLCAALFGIIFMFKDHIYGRFFLKSPALVSMNPYQYFNSISGVGRIHNLYSQETDYSFSLVNVEEGYGIFSLTQEGWEQVVVSYVPLREGGGVDVKGKGIDLTLIPEEFGVKRVSGTYINKISGDSGTWYIDVLETIRTDSIE